MKEGLDQVGDEGFSQPTETEAGEGDAKLRGRDIRLKVPGNVPGDECPLVSLLDKGIELSAPDLYDRQFGGNEESVQQDKRKNRRDPQENEFRGIPVIGWKRGGGQSGGIPCRHRQKDGDEHHGDLSWRDGSLMRRQKSRTPQGVRLGKSWER